MFVINVFGLRLESAAAILLIGILFFYNSKMTSLIFSIFSLTFLIFSVLECIELFFFRR